MLTYIYINSADFDYEDILDYVLVPCAVFLDLFFILFQPIFYLIYKRSDE